jgi:hypothetical protein
MLAWASRSAMGTTTTATIIAKRIPIRPIGKRTITLSHGIKATSGGTIRKITTFIATSFSAPAFSPL